jgi:hypothetical protein
MANVTYTSDMKATDVVRQAITRAGVSRYVISQRTGVPDSTLCRFMQGRPIVSDTIDVLVEALGLELRPKARRARKGRA